MLNERTRMIREQLTPRGIRHPRVLEAFKRVPRHRFVPERFARYAYEDSPLEIGLDQTISQPYIVALMSEAIDPRNTDKVLEIGTGSGYQTAILAELVEHVYTVERIEPLMHKAKRTLDNLGYTNITYALGDGHEGLPVHAPFDKIIVTAAAKRLPEALVDQLVEGGILVIPIGGHFFQDLVKITKNANGFKKESLGGCRFVPLIKSKT